MRTALPELCMSVRPRRGMRGSPTLLRYVPRQEVTPDNDLCRTDLLMSQESAAVRSLNRDVKEHLRAREDVSWH